MKTFKELCDNKIWKAVDAMLTGLKSQSERCDFKIDMTSFGHSKDGVCFGCAATCAVQQLAGENFIPDFIGTMSTQADFLKFDLYDMGAFETAIDELRKGIIYDLVRYFGKQKHIAFILEELKQCTVALPLLTTDTWHVNLQPYYDLLKLLKQNDL